MLEFFKKQGFKIGLFFLLGIVIYFTFGFYRVGKFITIDEDLWLYDRIPRYWTGIINHNWELTYVHEKPGITLSIISGIGLLKYHEPIVFTTQNSPSITHETGTMEKFLATFRLPLIIFNGIFSLFFFWIIRKITENGWIALWSVILMMLSPILIGMTRIVNADAVLWTFSTATLLSFVAYLKTEKKKFAFFASLFLGLSMLSKFVAVILLPFLFAIEIIYYLEKIKSADGVKTVTPEKIRNVSVAYLSIIAGAVLLFAVLLPASFVHFKYLFKGTFGYPGMEFVLWPIIGIQILMIVDYYLGKCKITQSVLAFLQKFWRWFSKLIYAFLLLCFTIILVNYVAGQDFLKLESVPFDALQAKVFYKNAWPIKILLEFRPLVFSVTPIILAFLLYLWTKSLFRPVKDNFTVLVLSMFVIIFETAVIQQDLLNLVRYSIVVYPVLSILAAIGLYEFINSLRGGKISRSLVSLFILGISFLSLWMIKPFFLNYTNDLLPKKYIISDAWGYGGYEAAQYLNSLPDAQNLAVWSDRSGVCEFFVGKCVKSECSLPEGYEKFDYYVLTRRGRILHIKNPSSYYKNSNKEDYRKCRKSPEIFKDIEKKYAFKNEPVVEWLIDGRPGNYVKIYEAGK